MSEKPAAAPSPRPIDVSAIVINPQTQAVLARETPAGLSLPSWQEAGDHLWEEMDWVSRQVAGITGLRVAALRCLQLDWDRDDGSRHSTYLLETLELDPLPVGGWLWVRLDAVAPSRFTTDGDRGAVQLWLAERPAPPKAPWYLPGWYTSTAEWIVEALRARGIEVYEPPEQVKSWSRSAILRVRTEAGWAYFKEAPGPLAHEFTVMEFINRIAPGQAPDVFVHDPQSHRALIRELPGNPLAEHLSIEVWESAYRQYAHLQKQVAARTAELLNAGVPAQRLPVIAAGIDDLLHDDDLLLTGRIGGLTSDQVERLRRHAPLLKEAVDELAEGGIPDSLDHGDFWPGNIYADGERAVFFDWSDSTVTHPFLSLIMTVDEVNAALPDIGRAGERVRDAYLAVWTGDVTIEHAKRLFDLAMLVAPLDQALLYQRRILPAIDSRWELERMAPMFLSWLVDTEIPRQVNTR